MELFELFVLLVIQQRLQSVNYLLKVNSVIAGFSFDLNFIKKFPMHLLDFALAEEVVQDDIIELETFCLVNSQTKHSF